MSKHNDYHIVQHVYRSKLGKIKYVPHHIKKQIRREFSMRVKFTKENYKGRYNTGHWYFMRNLSNHLGINDKLKMSLEECIAISKFQKK